MPNHRNAQSILGLVVALLLLAGLGLPASAGGSWFSPVKDSYEPGDTVTLVGYTGGGAYGWIEDGPFFGQVSRSSDVDGEPVEDVPFPVGELLLEETGNYGYTRLRVSISFDLPSNSLAGVYSFQYCNADCSEQLGDLIAGSFFVGIDPKYQISREWPLDEPEIANLDDTALISGPGFQVPAEEANANPRTDTTETVATITTTTSGTSVTAEALTERTTPTPAQADGQQDASAPVLSDQASSGRPAPTTAGLVAAAVAIAVAAGVSVRRRFKPA